MSTPSSESSESSESSDAPYSSQPPPASDVPPAPAPQSAELGARFEALGALLAPVDSHDPTWRWVIARMGDLRAPLLWLVSIGGVCVLGVAFLNLQGDALDFYPALFALRQLLGGVALLAALALGAIGWLAYRLRAAAAERHDAANALFLQAQTAPPEQRAALLDGALAAWRETLEVCPRNLGPHAWATTQLCLARAAAQRAQLGAPAADTTDGADDPLLEEAVTGYHIALRAYTPENALDGWLAAQRDLAATLRAQAERAPTAERAQRYAAAAAPLRAILATQPHDSRTWADTQIALASTLGDAARWAAPPDGRRLLDESLAAYQAASEVYARHASEREWAALQQTLGDACLRAADLADGAERARLLDDALAAYHGAQGILTRWVSQSHWAALQLVIGQTLHARAALEPLEPSPQRRDEILRAAVAAFDAALDVYTHDAHPEAWTACQQSLGAALRDLAALRAGPERAQLLTEAIAALESAHDSYTTLGQPERAARLRSEMDAMRIEAERPAAE